MNDAGRRAVRTLAQASTVSAAILAYNAFAWPQLTADQAAAITALGVPLVSFVQNLLEAQGAIPALLKGPAGPPPPSDLVQRELLALADAIRDLRADMAHEIRERRAP